jgi:hypothetical protein
MKKKEKYFLSIPFTAQYKSLLIIVGEACFVLCLCQSSKPLIEEKKSESTWKPYIRSSHFFFSLIDHLPLSVLDKDFYRVNFWIMCKHTSNFTKTKPDYLTISLCRVLFLHSLPYHRRRWHAPDTNHTCAQYFCKFGNVVFDDVIYESMI